MRTSWGYNAGSRRKGSKHSGRAREGQRSAAQRTQQRGAQAAVEGRAAPLAQQRRHRAANGAHRGVHRDPEAQHVQRVGQLCNAHSAGGSQKGE